MSGVIRLYGLLFLIDLVLVVIALIDCLSSEEFAVRNLPKVAWVFIILLFPPIGPIVWFVAGRPQGAATGRGARWRPGSGFPEYERPRPFGPDDDPEFLASKARERRDDQELLRKWEEDLRRREQELRRHDGESKGGVG